MNIDDVMALVDEYTDSFADARRADGGIQFADGIVCKVKKDAVRLALTKAAGEVDEAKLIISKAYTLVDELVDNQCIRVGRFEVFQQLLRDLELALGPEPRREASLRQAKADVVEALRLGLHLLNTPNPDGDEEDDVREIMRKAIEKAQAAPAYPPIIGQAMARALALLDEIRSFVILPPPTTRRRDAIAAQLLAGLAIVAPELYGVMSGDDPPGTWHKANPTIGDKL